MRSQISNPRHLDDFAKLTTTLSTYSQRLIDRDEGIMSWFGDGLEKDFSLASQWDSLVLIPYWKELAKALQQCESDNEYWWFRNIPAFPTSILVPALSSRIICLLELRNIGGSEVYRFLCEFLENNCSIKQLILRDMDDYLLYESNYIDGNSICRFCDAVEASNSLEELSLVNLNLGFDDSLDDYYLPLILGASRNLKYLRLQNSDLGEDMGRIISYFIAGNSSLKHLVLGGQPLSNFVDDKVQLNDDDVRRIAEALLSNTNLRILDLGLGLGLGTSSLDKGEGLKILRKALFSTKMQATGLFAPKKKSGLNAVVATNHTCSILYDSLVGEESPLRQELTLLDALNRNEDPAENRKWKILSILYATKCKGIDDEMDGVPLRLIPHVLALISSGDETSQDMSADDVTANEIGVTCGSNEENAYLMKTVLPEEMEDEEYPDDLSGDDDSIVSYDSELDDLESAFDEVDEVYDDFHKSFSDSTYITGKRARVTMMYQLLQKYGLPLMEGMSSPRAVKDGTFSSRDCNVDSRNHEKKSGRKRAHDES